MRKLNFIFVGGKNIGYETLNFLLKENFKPTFIVPNKDDNGRDNLFNKSVKKIANKNSLEIVNLKNLRKCIQKKNISIDLILCLGSTLILPKNIIKLAKIGALNIHPSLLPKYRGRYSLPHAIFNNEKYTGITIHWIGSSIDNGKIIKQKRIKITKNDTSETLYKKFTKTSIIEFKKIFRKIVQNKKLSELYPKKISTKYKKKHFPNKGKISWKWNGYKIYNFFRSMVHEPFPPPEIKLGSKSYFLVSKNYLNKSKFLKSPE